MLQPNPKPCSYAFSLPTGFFIDSICEKYNKMLKNMSGTFVNIQDVINESVQSIGLPGFAYEPSENKSQSQGLNNYVLTPPNNSLYEILDTKELSVSFRFCDGYLNYYCLLEHFLYKFMSNRHTSDGYDSPIPKEDRKMYCNLPVTLIMFNGWPLFTCTYLNCLMTGIDRVDLTYVQQLSDFREFKIAFRFTGVDCDLQIPEPTGLAKNV